MAAEGRRKLADVTPESYEGWSRFASAPGLDVTVLAECVGIYLGDIGDRRPSPALERVVRQARELRDERRRRPQI